MPADQLEGEDELEVRTQEHEHLVLGGHTAEHRASVAEAIARSECAVAEGIIASAEPALPGIAAVAEGVGTAIGGFVEDDGLDGLEGAVERRGVSLVACAAAGCADEIHTKHSTAASAQSSCHEHPGVPRA